MSQHTLPCPGTVTTRCLLASLGLACALCTGASAAEPALAGSRVRNVDVQHVAVDLRFDWRARQALGSAAITLSPLRPSAKVTLDAGMLAIDSVTLAQGAKKRKALRFDYNGGDQDDGLAIALDRTYQPKERLTIHIHYRTKWVDQSDPNNLWGSTGKGLRFFAPTTTDPRKRLQIWSSSEAGGNRYWLPGFDAPQDQHTSELRATVAAPLRVISNGQLVSTRNNADGTRTFHWKMERPHTHARNAFVVGEFVDVVQQHAGVTLRSHGYPDETQAVADSVVQLPDMLRFFSELIGQPFPFASYSQAFVQDFPWGHAGAGLALQSENMVDDKGTHADFLYLWDGLQAESLAHQWFGNHLAACDWRHAWLDRGFAHHLAGLYAEHHNGRDEHLLWYVQSDQNTTLSDWQSGTREALVPTQLSAKDTAAFVGGNTPWARGAAVLHMLRKELGDDSWRRVIRHFAREHAGKLVCSDDLRRSVEAVSGRAMGWFFEQWLLRPGQPMFEVSHQYDSLTKQLMLQVKQTQAEFYQGMVDIEIDGRIERVRLAPRALNSFSFTTAQAPQWVHFDVGSSWLKELVFAKTAAELLHQLRHTQDTLGQQWASAQLATLVKDPATPQAVRQEFHAVLREIALRKAYWRVRFNALQQLRNQLAPLPLPTPLVQAVALDDTTRQMLLKLIREEGSWLRTAAINLLGMTRDVQYADLYRQHLQDPSDRVVNAAAIALGRSTSPAAFEALAALPAHPSWKNQSLISALYGLRELGDPRGAELALKALSDVRSPRWTLSTPVWDYRIAAAETLASLGQGASAVPLLMGHFEAAMQEGDINDIFSNVLLLVTTATPADPRARQLLAPLKQRFAADANAMKAVEQFEQQLEAKLKPK
jgi:aminopeptidase N